MEFRELISGFGEACGVGELVLDENDVARIQADDIVLSFMEVPATRRLVMFADVADRPEEGAGQLFETLLRAQYLGGVLEGASFSVSPEGTITLHRSDRLVDLDAATFAKTVEAFLNLVDKWREAVAAFRPDAADADAPGDENPILDCNLFRV